MRITFKLYASLTQHLPVDARVPWDHIDIGLEPGFLADEYRKALASRVSPEGSAR